MGRLQSTVAPTLIEWLSEVSRIDTVSESLPVSSDKSSYVYVLLFIVFDGAVLNTYAHLRGGTHAVVRNPFYVALYLGILLAAVGTRYMRDGHLDSVELLVERGICDLERADDYALSFRTRVTLYAVGLLGFFSYQVFVIGISTVVQTQGLAGIVFTLVILPGCYLPVAIDFVSEYATLHVGIPRWLRQQDAGLFFFDPQNMGGFQPIGALLKRSYYFYTAGLLLYLAFYYGLFITPLGGAVANPPGAPEAGMFTILWLFGLATICYSMYEIHRIMKSERQRQLRVIEREIHNIIENPHDITEAEITDPDKLDALEYRLGQIQATSEYPTTFTMWAQIGISVLLPQALQMLLQATV